MNDSKNKMGEILNDSKTEAEIKKLILSEPKAIDIDKKEEDNETRWDRLSDKITAVIGSWKFIIIFSTILIAWIIINTLLLIPFDKYPFVLLNLLLSSVAALQAPIVMMSQNRKAKKDSLRVKNDYKTDLKSELLLEQLVEQINGIKRNQNKIIKKINNLK